MNDVVMKRADYKKIKAMNRAQLSDYLGRVWQRGYEKGYQAATQPNKPSPADNDAAQSAMAPAT